MNTKLRIPTVMSFTYKGEEAEAPYIICSWSNKYMFEKLLTTYKKEYYRTLFGIKTRYVLDSIEYIPSFVGIKLATVGYCDYEYNCKEFLEDFLEYNSTDFTYKAHWTGANLVYNLDTQEQRIDSFNVFATLRGKYHCYWRSSHDMCMCDHCNPTLRG